MLQEMIERGAARHRGVVSSHRGVRKQFRERHRDLGFGDEFHSLRAGVDVDVDSSDG